MYGPKQALGHSSELIINLAQTNIGPYLINQTQAQYELTLLEKKMARLLAPLNSPNRSNNKNKTQENKLSLLS
jgi:hypothetical protein